MFSVTQFTLFFLTLVVSVHSLATPRIRAAHIHRAIAARAPAPVPVADLQPWAAPRKRSKTRCGVPTSTSIAPAAAVTPVVAAEAAPPTTTAAATVETPAATVPAPSQPPVSTSSGGDVNTGDITFYGTGLGSCGITNSDTDFITAVSHDMFDTFPGAGANPNNNPICNRKINVTHLGKTITVTVVDRCTGCAFNDLDLSPAAFNALENPAVGRTKATWTWAT